MLCQHLMCISKNFKNFKDVSEGWKVPLQLRSCILVYILDLDFGQVESFIEL